MLPGYQGEENAPYFSPIRVRSVQPRITRRHILTLRFFNALYASGVQEATVDAQIVTHAPDFLVAQELRTDHGSAQRVFIVSRVTFGWLQRCCPELPTLRPARAMELLQPLDVQDYLDHAFPID